MIPESERHLVGVIDNYDKDGKPAGCLDKRPTINLDKSRMSAQDKKRLALVVAKAETGYYLDLERYKNSKDPAERARLAAIMEYKLDKATKQFEETWVDEQ